MRHMATPRLTIRAGNPDFLDLDWALPLSEWEGGRLVEMPTGIHRHPVVFVAYDEGIYAIKELPHRLALHESDVLRRLESRTLQSARLAGVAVRPWADPHEEYSAAVITRYVEYAFPYRHLVTGGGFGMRRDQMLDAFAWLLVELHLAGCFWGDCSLSNVLYRYDAAAIEAVMVDAETARLHDDLSEGQRHEDIALMEVNVAGEMGDIAAMDGLTLDDADLSLGEDIAERYAAVWAEIVEELVIAPDEQYKVQARIQRLNDLGFVAELVELEPTDSGDRVRLDIRVGGRTYHSQRLRERTGVDASENQARILLADLAYHVARSGGSSAAAAAVAAIEWRVAVFEPSVERIRGLRTGFDPVQGYCDLLHHRYVRASAEERDLPLREAFESWIAEGYPGFPLKDSPSGISDSTASLGPDGAGRVS